MSPSLKLTIGIPTFNGARRIGETLDSVLSQVTEALAGQLEVVVSDNASTDETEAVVRRYQNTSRVPILYSRHSKNMGYDFNVDSLFHRATGDYVWTLADDDTLRPGAIAKVVAALTSRPDLRIILVNFIAYDADLKEVRDAVEISGDAYCRTPEDFLKRSESKYSLLSSLVFNRAAWLQEDKAAGFGSNFIHVYALFKILRTGSSLIVAEPLVNYRQGSTNFGVSGDSILRTGLSACSVVSSMRAMGYESAITKWLLKKSERYIYGLVIASKLAGIQDKAYIARRLIAIYPTPTVFLKLVPAIFLPDRLFSVLYRLRKSTTRGLRCLKSRLFQSH